MERMNKEEALRRWKETIFSYTTCIPCLRIIEQLIEETGYSLAHIEYKHGKFTFKLEPVEKQ